MSLLKQFEIPKGFENVKKIEHFDIYKETKGYLNASSMKELLKSPAHFEYYMNNQKEETESMKLGTAIHTLLLEPDEFKKDYTCLFKKRLPHPDKDMRNKENKEYRASFIEDNPGKIIFTEDNWNKINTMVTNARKLPLVNKLLEPGSFEAEASYYFKLPEWNWKGKIRVDYRSKVLPIFMDVKTSKDTSVNGFRKEHGNYDYALQIAYYYTYLSQFEEIDPNSIYILAIGNTVPNLSALFHIPSEELEYGLSLMNVALNRLKIAEELNYFPGVEVQNFDPTTGNIEDNGVIDLNTYFKRDFVV
jgi:hypothetical protein